MKVYSNVNKNNSQYIYRLNFINKNSLESFRESLDKENDIEKVKKLKPISKVKH